MFLLLPTIDPAAVLGIALNVATTIISYEVIATLLSDIGLILLRKVGFYIDKKLINFINYFFNYFVDIIGGKLLTDAMVENMFNNIYFLIGVIIVFRLGMLLINYILNPADVMDEKVGVNALIKRVILGLVLLLFIPTIFSYCFRLQKAIIDDEVIERIIMPEDSLLKYKEYKQKHGVGKIIGMTIFQGFFSLSTKANDNATQNYNLAMNIEKTYDLEKIDDLTGFNGNGILHHSGFDYSHNYFFVLSTVVLGYVLYLMIQYCLDAVVRSFKLSVLQVIAPIAIVEYMINKDRNEVFKSWVKAVVSTFAMLFMRVASIWFVAYVTTMMQNAELVKKTLGQNEETLLTTSDTLLKAIIVLGLLAFMMDFPKMISDIFGLDLDQSGSVKNVMGKAMGAGLAVGGAYVGATMKVGGALAGTAKGSLGKVVGDKTKHKAAFTSGLTNPGKTALGQFGGLASKIPGVGKGMAKIDGSKKAQKLFSSVSSSAKENALGTTMISGVKAMGTAVLMSNALTKDATSGYQQASQSVDGEQSKKRAAMDKENEAKMSKQQREEELVRNITERVVETLPKGTSKEEVRAKVVGQLLGVDATTVSATVKGKLDGITSTGKTVDAGAITQTVTQVLGNKVDVTPQQVEQFVNQVVKDPANVTTAELAQVVNQVMGASVSEQAGTIDQVVSQVYGTRVNNSVDDATQKVTQQLDKIVTNTEEMNVYAEISTEYIQNMSQDISQQVSIQRDIKTNTEETNVYSQLTAENTEAIKNKD